MPGIGMVLQIIHGCCHQILRPRETRHTEQLRITVDPWMQEPLAYRERIDSTDNPLYIALTLLSLHTVGLSRALLE